MATATSVLGLLSNRTCLDAAFFAQLVPRAKGAQSGVIVAENTQHHSKSYPSRQ
jgi:hypothetical protein